MESFVKNVAKFLLCHLKDQLFFFSCCCCLFLLWLILSVIVFVFGSILCLFFGYCQQYQIDGSGVEKEKNYLNQIGWEAVCEQIEESVCGRCVPPLPVVQLLIGVGQAGSEKMVFHMIGCRTLMASIGKNNHLMVMVSRIPRVTAISVVVM